MSAPSIERINVNFPSPVLEDLRRLVPAKRRSEVIARATARELRRLKLAAQFEQAALHPIWQAETYPQLADDDAVDTTLAQLRAAGHLTVAPNPMAPPRRKGRRE
ncbi:MAG: hypothetical protein HY741_15320 [Chloroflexi bacterium]|nr:hypothetical protein [Chloroflexota bacterium]